MRFLIIFLVFLFSYAHAATLLPPGEQTFFDENGNPLAAGTVTFYIPNTTTFKNTWKDSGQTILNTNPIVLDSSGRAIIYGSGVYRQIVKDSLGNIIWDRLTADTSSATNSWSGTSGGSGNSQTVNAANFSSADGQVISFIAGFTNSGATTINPNGIGPISVLKDTSSGPVALTGGEIVAGNAVSVVYDATAGAFHLISYPIPAAIITNSITASIIQSTGAFILSGTISPAALAANTNNWSPTGFSSATMIRLSASNSINITGLAARPSGTMVVLQNVGSSAITLTANDTNSLAANRFVFGRALELQPAESISIWYDSSSVGWRLFHAGPSLPIASGYKQLKVQTTSASQIQVTADAITLESDTGATYRARSINVTANISTSGVNGLDTGAEASNTWYSVWVIYNSSTNTISSLLSVSTISPTMPPGYDYKTRVSWVRNDSSSNFYRIIQYGRRAQYIVGTNPATSITVSTGPAAQWTAVSWGNFAPPTAAVLNMGSNSVSSTALILVAPNGSWATNEAYNGFNVAVGASMFSSWDMIPESSNIYWYATGALPLYINGWEDNL